MINRPTLRNSSTPIKTGPEGALLSTDDAKVGADDAKVGRRKRKGMDNGYMNEGITDTMTGIGVQGT